MLPIDKAEAGTHLYPGFIPLFSLDASTLERPAPCFGEHNEYVFGKILGLPAQEVEALVKERIISKAPIFPE
jgi:hypothetical protein